MPQIMTDRFDGRIGYVLMRGRVGLAANVALARHAYPRIAST